MRVVMATAFSASAGSHPSRTHRPWNVRIDSKTPRWCVPGHIGLDSVSHVCPRIVQDAGQRQKLFNTRTLCFISTVHYVCTCCTLCVHCVYTVCTLCVHCVCTVCTLCVHCVYTVCTVCALCVHCVCTVCALCVYTVCAPILSRR